MMATTIKIPHIPNLILKVGSVIPGSTYRARIVEVTPRKLHTPIVDE